MKERLAKDFISNDSFRKRVFREELAIAAIGVGEENSLCAHLHKLGDSSL